MAHKPEIWKKVIAKWKCGPRRCWWEIIYMCRIAKADCGFIFFLQNHETRGWFGVFQANSQAKRNHGTLIPRVEKNLGYKIGWPRRQIKKHDHLFVRPFSVGNIKKRDITYTYIHKQTKHHHLFVQTILKKRDISYFNQESKVRKHIFIWPISAI